MTLDGTVCGLQAPVKPREEGMNPLRLACESHLLSLSKQLAPRSRRRRMLGTVATLRLSRNHIPRIPSNRTEFFTGHQAIKAFLKRKWEKELDYRLMEELWCFTGNRIPYDSNTNGMTLL